MISPSDDDDLSLSGDLESFADAIAGMKNLPGTDPDTWTALDAAETDVRAEASSLTVDAVTATLASAGQNLADLRASVKQAKAAVQKIADVASALQKVAVVITVVGTLVKVAGSISSGNVAGVIAGIKDLPGQVTSLASKA
jgi:hypothetical protein